jgi:hypothetical protein
VAGELEDVRPIYRRLSLHERSSFRGCAAGANAAHFPQGRDQAR